MVAQGLRCRGIHKHRLDARRPAHLHRVHQAIEDDEDGAQGACGHAARLVVDLCPEEHQQRVGGEEQQACEGCRGWGCWLEQGSRRGAV